MADVGVCGSFPHIVMRCSSVPSYVCVGVGKLSSESLLHHGAERLSEIFNTLLHWYAPFLQLFVQV